MKLYSQRDTRWKNEPLGFSTTTTIGSHGCTITCIAMLADLTPSEVNQRLKSVNGYALKNLVIWSKINEAIPWLEFEWRSYTYNNDKVSQAIEDNGGCLVEVDFDGTPRTSDRHWVLFTGSQKMSDPWTGTVEPTSTYPLLEGYSIIKVKENMSDTIQVERKDWERARKSMDVLEDVHEYLELPGDHIDGGSEPYKNAIGGYKSQATALRRDLANCQQEVKNREEQISRLKDEIASKETECKKTVGSMQSILQETEGMLGECKLGKETLSKELDELYKEKGRLEKELAVCQSDLEECRKGNPTEGCWETFINNVKKLFERN